MDRVYTPKQFVVLFDTATTDEQNSMMFQAEFGPLRRVPHGGQCSHSMHKRMSPLSHLSFRNCIAIDVVIDYVSLKGTHNETVIKEIALVADSVIRIPHFQAPYDMQPHGSAENRFNLDEGHIFYHQLKRMLLKLWRYTHICIHTTIRNVERLPS
jgi:hypothetical protein